MYTGNVYTNKTCYIVYVCSFSQHDPIAELLLTYFPSAPRKTLPSVESVPMDMTGLRRLVVSIYNDVIIMSSTSHTHTHFKLKTCSCVF